jgi:CHASE2 domain-containing sensor protein
MRNLCIGFLSLMLVWAGHAPAIEMSHPSNAIAATAHNPQRQTFWQRFKGYVFKPLTGVKALPKRLLQSERELIRLLILILIVALIVSLVVWLLPWPLDVIVMVLALVVALIFLLRYLG